ncbi:MAG: hypothetical protein FWC50_13230 [Planctomycetaceae bacterium]|nr:hypothetical protein [Planctomycetaceae bacterium]
METEEIYMPRTGQTQGKWQPLENTKRKWHVGRPYHCVKLNPMKEERMGK